MSAINDAKSVIAAEAARLTAMIRAKGYTKSYASIWIGHNARTGHCVIFAEGVDAMVHDRFDLEEAIGKAEEKIAALTDLSAYAADFEGRLFLASEHA